MYNFKKLERLRRIHRLVQCKITGTLLKSKILTFYFLLFSITTTFAQASHWAIDLNYGAAYSFFVKYEQPPEEVPPGFIGLFNKDRIGTAFEASFTLYFHENKNKLALHYARQVHIGEKNFEQPPFFVNNFKLRHINNMYSISYARSLMQDNSLYAGLGFGILNPQQQEIEIFNYYLVEERDRQSHSLQEGILWAGVDYRRPFSGNFELGIRARLYYVVSAFYFEAFTLTPTLSYRF